MSLHRLFIHRAARLAAASLTFAALGAIEACAAPSADTTDTTSSARDYPGGIGNGGSGDPSDVEIWFGEYTNWRFRHCQEGF